jgi:hypothetical protein
MVEREATTSVDGQRLAAICDSHDFPRHRNVLAEDFSYCRMGFQRFLEHRWYRKGMRGSASPF